MLYFVRVFHRELNAGVVRGFVVILKMYKLLLKFNQSFVYLNLVLVVQATVEVKFK